MRLFLLLFLSAFTAFSQKKPIKLAALPDLSPNGEELVFSWLGDLWKVSSEGGEAERITSHPGEDTSPTFSPDGKSIAFVSSREGNRQVYVMAKDGTVPKRVGFMSEGYSIEDWYPDGKSLLVTSMRDNYGRYGRRFYRLPLAREAEKEVFKAGVNRGSINRAGNKILFSREGDDLYRKGYRGSRTNQIWLYEESSSDISQVLKGEFSYRSPMWGEEEDVIYYSSDEDGTFNIWRYNLKEKKKKQLTQFKDDGVILPSISRDGTKIVFRRQFDFYILDVSSAEAKKLDIWCNEDLSLVKDRVVTAANTADLDVSSDGLEFIFTAGFDIWAMDKILKEPIRITETPEVERDVLFSHDNNSVFCIRDDGVNCQVLKIEKSTEKYWWQSDKFTEKVLLSSEQNIHSMKLSPKGKYLSYIKGNGDLYTFELSSGKENMFLKSWDAPMYSWSPDEKWISYAVEDDNFNNDVWLKKLDGSKPAFNVSQHPEYDGYPSFSPDGKFLAFSTNRNDAGYEIAYVSLLKETYEESSRDRKLEKALNEMKKRKTPAKKPTVDPAKAVEKKEVPAKDTKPQEAKVKKSAVEKKVEVAIVDLDGLEKRVKFIKNPGDDYNPFWSPDGKKLAFNNSLNKKATILYVSLPENLKPTLLYKDALRPIKWLKANDQLYCSIKNVPALISRGKVNTYPFKASYKESRSVLNRNVFRNIWRNMRDHFYDEKLNNKNWETILEKYEPQAEMAPDERIFDRVSAMLLGELNASHTGYRSAYKSWSANYSHDITGHLGVRFDKTFKGPGLKVQEVIEGSNADKVDTKLNAGDIILSIDGTACDISKDLTLFLNGRLARDIELKVKDAKGGDRLLKIRPHSYSEIRSLLYDQQMEKRKAVVREKSKGKMGYLHVSRMMWPEFNKFREEVYKEGNGRDGLVIDVRNNGGGFTADHLISVLTQPRHAVTVPRNGGPGYPFSRQVYLNWYKPIVVLCNQFSFSNAEIFTHAIKSLKRGKVVGVATAGGVISTGAKSILGKGTLRMPFRGWYLSSTGEDMELNGAVPDVVIWPIPGELEKGKDVQLEKAIEVLAEDIKEFNSKNKLKLKKASER